MSVTTVKITQKEPVHFRVRSIEPHPVPAHLRSPWDELLLSIDRIGQAGINFGLSREQYAPYHEAVTEAVATQQVYWVDLDYSNTTNWPPSLDDATSDRF